MLEGMSLDDCQTPNRPYILGLNDDDHRAVLFQPRCKMWSCPFCAEVNKNLWAVRAYIGTRVLQDTDLQVSFVTLTPHESLTPDQSMWVFPRAWKKLSQRARRAAEQFDYIMIPERFVKGPIHVHAIATGPMDEEWWKDNSRSSGLGYMAKATRVRKPQGAAAYAVKYLEKSIAFYDWPARFRRVRVSHRWPELPKLDPPQGWRFLPVSLSDPLTDIVHRYTRRGYDIRVLGSAAAWTYVEPPTENTQES
jgi:hypothetical protein